MKNGKAYAIMASVIVACAAMGWIDAVIQPGYAAKSIVKIFLFAGIPALHARLSGSGYQKMRMPDGKGMLASILAGIIVYVIVVGAYFIAKHFFDFSSLVTSLNETTGVNRSNFLYVSLYISFINSFLEEYFFRGFAFLALQQEMHGKIAMGFSSLMFALYHIAMMIGWFGVPVILLAIAGLIAGGILFALVDEKSGNIAMSWLIHMCANFATNTIGWMLMLA